MPPIPRPRWVPAKIRANGLVIVAAAVLPVAGSTALFALGAAAYLFSVTSPGVMLSTIAATMPQFGLLSIPVFVVLNLLSGGMTPLESMPAALRMVMLAASPTRYPRPSRLAAARAIGALFFAFALYRFRATMATAR